MAAQSDESLGLDHLPQSQLESTPGLHPSPILDLDTDPMHRGDREDAQVPEQILRSLISENGLVVVLDALNDLIKAQAERLQDSTMKSYSKQLQSFQDTSEKLTELIEMLPPELDMEIALAQVTHVTPTLESTPTKLTTDLDDL